MVPPLLFTHRRKSSYNHPVVDPPDPPDPPELSGPSSPPPSLPTPRTSPFTVTLPQNSHPYPHTYQRSPPRPATPLDFLRNVSHPKSPKSQSEHNKPNSQQLAHMELVPAFAPISPPLEHKQTHNPTSQSNTQHRRVRSSMELERPAVDPAIKGIPQAFPDDPSIPTSPTSPTSPFPPLPPTSPTSQFSRGGKPQPQPQPQPQFQPQRAVPSTPSRRLGTFRESTRVKLASFNGLNVIKGADRVDRAEERQRSAEVKPQNSRAPTTENSGSRPDLAARSSSLAKPTSNVPLPDILAVSQPKTPRSQFPEATLQYDPSLTVSTETGTSTTEDFSHLFTPSATSPNVAYAPSATSTQSSHSNNRDRVLGFKHDTITAGSRIFVQPKLSDVVPFADDSPFSAWEPPPNISIGPGTGRAGRKASMRQSVHSVNTASTSFSSANRPVPERGEGWREVRGPRGSGVAKRVWRDIDEDGERVYRVGWEREVLDLEARLHETMWEVAGESHTFCDFAPGEVPKTVLDIGTGTGLWPISQALEWPDTTFVGLDFVPCQTDLRVLANAERNARSTSGGTAAGLGTWESIEKRIKWDRANFLESLPYDTGVFDMVHIRFIGLGVPESKWNHIIEECTRVLKRGGILEIVETGYTTPPSFPASLRNSFASLLLSDMIQPLPSLTVNFILPLSVELEGDRKPVFERTWKGDEEIPGALKDHMMCWVRSALEYKGTGLSRGTVKGGAGHRALREFCAVDGKRWVGDTEKEQESEGGAVEEDNEVTVWAWVIKKA